MKKEINLIEIDNQEIDYQIKEQKENVFLLISSFFLSDVLLYNMFDEKTQTEYCELRSFIGNYMYNVFDFKVTNENIGLVIQYIINNNI